MPALLEGVVKRHGDRPALSLDDHHFTYTEMYSLVSRVAKCLQRLGVAPGDRVAIMMPNHPAVPIWFYGALSVGAAVVSINALYSITTIEYMLGDSGAKVILALDDPESLAKLMPSLERGTLAQIVTVSPGVAELRFATKGSLSSPVGVLPFSELLNNDGKFTAPPIEPTGTLAGSSIPAEPPGSRRGRC
nr:AMP-binding protein [Bradyrhizobium tropiciagri]